MDISGKRIGVALTGSFCTYESVIPQIKKLSEKGARVTAIFSKAAAGTDSRFGKADEFMRRIREITKSEPILTIQEAEPIGPKGLLDLLVIMPCTGNTIAKLANGITDSPVLMAAKAHMRNDAPLLLSISTNDALGINMKNIGCLLSIKNIYFVPFGQDNPEKKPNSMIAHVEYLIPAAEMALEKRQLQPVVLSPFDVQ